MGHRITHFGPAAHVLPTALAGNLTAVLLLVLALFACLAWAARRGLLAAREAAWVGSALAFLSISLVFNAVVAHNAGAYPHNTARLVGVSALMTLPLLPALGGGVFALARSLVPKTLRTARVGGCTLLLVQGSPAQFHTDPLVDALLVPAATDLAPRGALAQSLRAFGGPHLAPEASALALAPVAVGQAVRSGAGALPFAHVVYAALHAPGTPVTRADAKRALQAAFRCARQNTARRVALPPFGSGPGALPPGQAASLTMEGVLRARKDFDLVAIVVLDKRLVPAFRSEFAALVQKHPAPPPAA